MSRSAVERLEDILDACEAIERYVKRGPASEPLADGMVFDAVMRRLEVIGEAVKGLDDAMLAAEPGVPWRRIAGMRNHIAHRYWDTAYGSSMVPSQTISRSCEAPQSACLRGSTCLTAEAPP